MICKQCGKDFASDLIVCPHCGATVPAQVSLGSLSAQAAKEATPANKKKSDPDRGLRIALIVISIVAVLAILGAIVAQFWPDLLIFFGKDVVEKSAQIDDKFSVEEQEEMDVNPELPTAKEGIQNIALLGLDERGDTGELVDSAGKGKSFHSDAIIILTIDRRDPENPRIKMSSIARDTLVYVEGYNSKANKTKLTHAFQYGYNKAKAADAANRNAIKKQYKGDELKKQLAQLEANYKREGAKTQIKTINYNFHMNITEYVYVNFVEFMDIIDYVGGVKINVQFKKGQQGLNELNKHIGAMEKECGRDLSTVKKLGEQTLSGGQALAYARIRKVDSDLNRGSRQREVLQALFQKVKETPITQLPTVVAKILHLCHTTLTAEEMIELGTWAVTNNPEILEYALPDTKVYGYSWIWEGNHLYYNWVWVYDLDFASALLIDFIFDKETAKDLPKPTKPNEPLKTQATTTGKPTETTQPDFSDPTGGYIDPTGSVSGDSTATGTHTGSSSGDPTATDPTNTDVIGTVGSTDTTEPNDSTNPTNSTDFTQSTEPTHSATPSVGVVGTTVPTLPGAA